MIKKLLSTTLATLAIVSMSSPTIAVETPAQPPNDFINIDKDSIDHNPMNCTNFIEEAEKIEKSDKDLQLWEEEDVKDSDFVAIKVDNYQYQSLKDCDKSTGYIEIRDGVKLFKKNISDCYYAATKFDAITVVSRTYDAAKNMRSIAKGSILNPISGAVRYTYNNRKRIKNCVKNLYNLYTSSYK